MQNVTSSPRGQEVLPIPGYEDSYFISRDGRVFNRQGRVLKEYPTRQGVAVELRHLGQREKVLISKLLERLEDSHGCV